MSYIFKKKIDPEIKFPQTEITFEIPQYDVTLTDLLAEFEDFLRGCGYQFNGSIEVVEDD